MSESDTTLTIPAAVERAARLFGNRRAYVEGGRQVTWGEVWRLSSDCAAGLVALGLRRGDHVAICAENSIDWLLALNAISMAGGIAVLVYYDLKPNEIVDQVTHAECRFLVASESVLAGLPGSVLGIETTIGPGPGATTTVDGLPALATDESRAELAQRRPAPDDLAAIIYTSGTTGGAKGVMLTQRNFLSNALAASQVLDVSEEDSAMLVLPLHHALPFLATAVLAPLIGASFVIENDLRRVRDRLQEHRPTIFFGVPALYELMYRNLLARAESEGRLDSLQQWQSRLRWVKRLTGLNLAPLLFRPVHKALGGRLRFMVSGGAALKPGTALDFFSLGLPLLQGWGMTEAAPAIALQPFSRRRFLTTRYYERHAGSVGPALPGMQIHLIDVPDKGISAASGEGEVLVRGANVFAGYWRGAEETAAAMQDGWLRTGDLARIERDGSIYLTGRCKYIIVLDSGEKVHPDELEARLSESDLLQDVCIVGREARGKTLVTAIVYADVDAARQRLSGAPLTEPALRTQVEDEIERLGKQLAAYKRVSRVELTDQPLPRTVLRKVARGRLLETYDFDLDRWIASADEAGSGT